MTLFVMLNKCKKGELICDALVFIVVDLRFKDWHELSSFLCQILVGLFFSGI